MVKLEFWYVCKIWSVSQCSQEQFHTKCDKLLNKFVETLNITDKMFPLDASLPVTPGKSQVIYKAKRGGCNNINV